MKRIGILSDTHGFLDMSLRKHFDECQEIWHAGDIGSFEVLDSLRDWGKVTRVVYGNIDSAEIRRETDLNLIWDCAGLKVLMTHIAGYPDRYDARAKELIQDHKPDLVVCGHSHILKVIYDKKLDHLHINPGAAGNHGIHHVRTAVRFTVEDTHISNMQILELGARGGSLI